MYKFFFQDETVRAKEKDAHYYYYYDTASSWTCTIAAIANATK